MVNIGGENGMNVPSGHGEFFDQNAGGGPEDQGSDMRSGHDDKSSRTPYTMPGVLHFIQHEWARFEMERAQWEMEKAEYQARISFLQGERKGHENLKLDLVRRIKMLEFSLKQERLKTYKALHNGEEPDLETLGIDEADGMEQQVPMDVDAVSNAQVNSNVSWKQGRQLLRQYLQEIGYSETILDVRSYRVRSLLGLVPGDSAVPSGEKPEGGVGVPRDMAERMLYENQQAVMDTSDFINPSYNKGGKPAPVEESHSDSDDDGVDGKTKPLKRKEESTNLAPDEQEALNEFEFLSGETAYDRAGYGKQKSTSSDGSGAGADSQWNIDQSQLDKMKSQYRMEAKHKKAKHDLTSMIQMLDGGQTGEAGQPQAPEGAKKDGLEQYVFGTSGTLPADIDSALGLTATGTGARGVDIRDEFMNDEDGALPKKWNLKYTLRNHFDAVRQMQFHPVEPLVCTASDDGTVKLWNLARTNVDDSTKTTITDLEPVYTFRGHRGAVLSLVLSPTGDQCYTGGADGTVRCWNVPSPCMEVYDKFDSSVLTETLRGHHNAVWSVAFHASDNRLISAGADGAVKLWEPGAPEPLLKTYGPPRADAVPTSIDFVSTEPQQVLVSYYPGTGASILDLETGKTVVKFDCSTDDGQVARVTKVAAHPTMPVTVTAGEDRRIRYFDNNTGQLIHGTVAHVEAISSLALDPNGLYLLSGAHDGSLRLWNMEKRVCLQEIAAHRKKLDESVLAVAFHPSRPLIGSAGADALAKIYQ